MTQYRSIGPPQTVVWGWDLKHYSKPWNLIKGPFSHKQQEMSSVRGHLFSKEFFFSKYCSEYSQDSVSTLFEPELSPKQIRIKKYLFFLKLAQFEN